MGRLKDKVLKEVNKKKSKAPQIAVLHDQLMAEYGWVPFEEFKQLPMATINSLLQAANERHERENKKNKGGKGGIPKKPKKPKTPKK